MTDLAAFIDEVSKHQFGWPHSLRFTYDKTRELLAAGVKGDLVECGVGAGVHPAMMARALMDAGEVRPVRLFDSFAGLPHGGEHDREWNVHYGDGSGRLESTGVAAVSLGAVQGNLHRWGLDGDLFTFFPGWFEHVLPKVAPAWRARYEKGEADGIALLRLDGDLYASTMVCLRELYPLVVEGGVAVIDDWNLDGCRAAVRDYFHSRNEYVPTIEKITESGDVWWTKL